MKFVAEITLRTVPFEAEDEAEARALAGTLPLGMLFRGREPIAKTQVIETDQIHTPGIDPMSITAVDGIDFDNAGNPTFYHMLSNHPGDLVWSGTLKDILIPADQMMHWYRPNRAGEVRGIPRITPGLPLIAQIRGFTSATLAAARLGAQYAGFVHTNMAPVDGPAQVAAYDHVEADDGTILTLPEGWEFTQNTPVHPGASNKEFRAAVLSTIQTDLAHEQRARDRRP